MKRDPKLVGALLGIILCMSLFSAVTPPAFSSPPPPKITFKGLEGGCKIFELTDTDGGVGGFIKKVVVDGTNITPTVTPVIAAAQVGDIHTFDYPLTGEATQKKVTLKVCPTDPTKTMEFILSVFDQDDVVSEVRVENVLAKGDKGTKFSGVFIIPKFIDCKKITKQFQQVLGDVKVDCMKLSAVEIAQALVDNFLTGVVFTIDDLEGGTKITVTGIVDTKKVGAIGFDPVNIFFLLMLEVCVNTQGDPDCPTEFSTLINFPILPIGGKVLPIDTTSLLLSSTQTFSWMIPVVLSVLGIGLFVVSRKSE